MPTITTVDPVWETGVTNDAAELRRAESTAFLGDGSNNGVRGGIVRHGDNSLAVSINGSDQVTVQAGAAVIPAATGLGVYRVSLSAATSATAIDSRNATNPRIDLVVFRSTGAVDIITGTPGASPSAPALPAQAVELARISVPAVGGGAAIVDMSWRTFATALGGMIVVPTAARLYGPGNQSGQRARALDTGIEYRWNGTTWDTLAHDVTNGTFGSGVSTGTWLCYRRGGVGILAFDFTVNSAIPAFTTMGSLPVGSRPPSTIPGVASNLTTAARVDTYVGASGELFLRSALANGDQVVGSMTIPLV